MKKIIIETVIWYLGLEQIFLKFRE
jgi:hypothetical protein